MKSNIYIHWMFFLVVGLFSVYGCTKDKCETVKCVNGGTCSDGSCNCPQGYLGSNCEKIDKPYFLCNNSSKKWKIISSESNGKKKLIDEQSRYFWDLTVAGKLFLTSNSNTDTIVSDWSYDQPLDKLIMGGDTLDAFTVTKDTLTTTKIGSVKKILTFARF